MIKTKSSTINSLGKSTVWNQIELQRIKSQITKPKKGK